MRILGIGDDNDLGDMYLRLRARGHDVRVHIADEGSADSMTGMITHAPDVRAALAWVKEARDDGLVLFESSSRGETQDRLRMEGYRVVGGSAFGDRLEQERAFGQGALRAIGLPTLATHSFASFDDAIDFVRSTRQRYVLKFNGAGFASSRNYVGMREDGIDVVSALRHQKSTWQLDLPPDFLLMDHVRGVEMGVGAFFDGERFLGPPNLDWEHKRLFPGDLGELTGEMGTLVTYRGAEKCFAATLAKLAPAFATAGHVGYVNLNTIVNEHGIWPLELTCRFGYPGFAVLSALHAQPWDDLLVALVERRGLPIATHDGYGVGVVLTVPPCPYREGYERLSKGAPIFIDPDLSLVEREGLHFAEVRKVGDELVTAGVVGYVMVVTARGATVEEAQSGAYRLAAKIAIPNVRYRDDIGARFLREDRHTLRRLGWCA